MLKIKNIFLIVISIVFLSSCAVEPDQLKRVNGSDQCLDIEGFLDLEETPTWKKITIEGDKGIMLWITDKIQEIMNDATLLMYEEIADDDDFRLVLATLMTLSIMFYALAIMLGIAQASGYSMVIFVIKLTFIYNFAMNFDLFKEYVIDTIEAGIADIIRSTEGIFHDYRIYNESDGNPGGQTEGMLFNEIDNLLSYLWDFKTMTLAMTLIPTGVTGFFWAIMLLALVFLYTFAIILAVKTFLLALIARFVLYALAPIFLSLALFNQTRSLFDGYIEQIINFSLQPIFLFIFLGMFHMVLVGFINSIYVEGLAGGSDIYSGGPDDSGETGGDFCIKWKQVLTLGEKPLYWPSLCKKQSGSIEESCYTMDDNTKPLIPIDLWMLISCVIVCYLMYSMLHWVVDVAGKMSSGLVTVSDVPIQGASQIGNAIKNQGNAFWSGIRNSVGK